MFRRVFGFAAMMAVEALALSSCVGQGDPLARGYGFDLQTGEVELAYRVPRKTFSLSEDIPIAVSFGHMEEWSTLVAMAQARLFLELRSDRGGADGFESYDLCIIPIDGFKTDKYVYRNSRFTGKAFTPTENYAIPKWILQEEHEEDAYIEFTTYLFLERRDWDAQGNPIGDLVMSGFAYELITFRYIDENTVEFR